MASDLTFDFSDDELDALLSGDPGAEAPLLDDGPPGFDVAGEDGEDWSEEDESTDAIELRTLTRTLAGQYLDVLAVFVRQVFASRPGAATPGGKAQTAIKNLLRLTEATGDTEMQQVLSDIDGLISQGVPRGKRDRHNFLRGLRDHVLGFADCLSDEDRQRMRGLILHEDRALPLLDELAEIRGIGPRRLERLYCAGLFTVEALSEADPEDIAQVTGIPLNIATEVVRATMDFAEKQRARIVRDLEQRARDFARALPHLKSDGRDELLILARQALRTLEASLADLEEGT